MKKYNYYDDEYVDSKATVFFKDLGNRIYFGFYHFFRLTIGGLASDMKGRTPKEFFQFIFRERKKRIKVTLSILLVLIIIVSIFGFSANIRSSNKLDEKYKTDAGEVCAEIIADYGTCKTEMLDEKFGDDTCRLTGLCYLRRMDFDNNGKDELFVAYNNNGTYMFEVWGYKGKEFSKIYSAKANYETSDKTVGSWVTLYHHSNQYFIGELTDDETTMNLLSLSGDEFKKKSTCKYDAKNDIYAVNDKIDPENFETIKFSFITTLKADAISDIITDMIDNFNVDVATFERTDAAKSQLKMDAFYKIVEEYNSKYGVAKYNSDSNTCFADGVAVVSLIDFNHDDNKEMMLIYRKSIKVLDEDKSGNYAAGKDSEYCTDIYSWNGEKAVEIYSSEGLSTFLDSDSKDEFYILKYANSNVYLCRNTYVYDQYSTRKWKATSRILELTDNNTFETNFVAVENSNYGYKKCTIDGKAVRTSEFESKGYQVPYFCSSSDETKYEDSEYKVIFVKGSSARGTSVKNVIDSTQKTIKELKADYNATAE